jgi:hypothetical protein
MAAKSGRRDRLWPSLFMGAKLALLETTVTCTRAGPPSTANCLGVLKGPIGQGHSPPLEALADGLS